MYPIAQPSSFFATLPELAFSILGNFGNRLLESTTRGIIRIGIMAKWQRNNSSSGILNTRKPNPSLLHSCFVIVIGR
jgi:hypothetical protein